MHPGFPRGSVIKTPPANAGAAGHIGLIPGSGRSPGGENGSPLQYSCLQNPMDRGVWWAIIPGVAKESDRTEHLKNNIVALEHCLSFCCTEGEPATCRCINMY